MIFADARSTDGSVRAIRRYTNRHENTQLLVYGGVTTYAGRARNMAVPFIQGKYSLFFDADDDMNVEAWLHAVLQAEHENADVAFVKYARTYEKSGGSWGTPMGMHASDEQVWRSIGRGDNMSLSMGLINYPWNRIIRTSQMMSKSVHFGLNAVHNDVAFHWLSLHSARKIIFVNKVGTIHRYHVSHSQLTSNTDIARAKTIHHDLRYLHHRMSQTNAWSKVRAPFATSAIKLLKWISTKVGRQTINLHETDFTQNCILSNHSYACFR